MILIIMLLFGHVGITLGVSAVVARTFSNNRVRPDWFASLSHYIDIRILMFGSLLPDIIDKPVGQYFFRDTFDNGRIFSHTLLFLILVAAGGFYLFKWHRQVWMFSLAAGTLMHLILDELWTAPATLFWPLLGFTFEKIDLTGWASSIFESLLSDPKIYISELIGLLIVIWFGLALIHRKRVAAFIKYGKVS